jgi:Fe-S-cluster containining protein
VDAEDLEKAVAYVEALHRLVDEQAAGLAARHRERLACQRGCSGCCVDGLTVFEVEAARIRRAHPDLLDEGSPAPGGRCAFLDGEGGCRVYAVRPYVCRTQGLPLRWREETETGAEEARDICPLNAEGPPLESLPADALWTLGPVEARLHAVQVKLDGGEARRVPLRALFRHGGPGQK